ncbi:signal peptidase I [Streptomyces sp. NPDC004787]|uniref:signal peptidase I n=1 Tax=Streptomyces sp. NPDC004787 TaxID=3154291 RepID=UPI0033BF9A51
MRVLPSPGLKDDSAGTVPVSEAEAPRRKGFMILLHPLRFVTLTLLLTFVLKTFILQVFTVPSGSMENTLQVGDRVVVEKVSTRLGASVDKGDIVVFRDPGGWLPPGPLQTTWKESLSRFIGWPAADGYLVKRVVATGGDTVECQGDGPLKVNGKAVHEDYVYPGDGPCAGRAFGPVKVPSNKLWVMGDHRGASADSRYHPAVDGGFVSESAVAGVVVFVF